MNDNERRAIAESVAGKAIESMTREMSTGTLMGMGVVADITPGVSDVKGVVDAFNSPAPVSIGSAVIGILPVLGDASCER